MSDSHNVPPTPKTASGKRNASSRSRKKGSLALGKELLHLGVGLADLAVERISEMQSELTARGAKRTERVSAAAEALRKDLHKRAGKVESKVRRSAEDAAGAVADGMQRAAKRVRKPFGN